MNIVLNKHWTQVDVPVGTGRPMYDQRPYGSLKQC